MVMAVMIVTMKFYRLCVIRSLITVMMAMIIMMMLTIMMMTIVINKE